MVSRARSAVLSMPVGEGAPRDARHTTCPARAAQLGAGRILVGMPDTPSLTLIKQFDYRGLPEEWSNTYHFKGIPTPSNDNEWRQLAMQVWDQEKTVIQPSSILVRGYGYNAGDENSASQIEFTGVDPGELAGACSVDGINMAGDQAVWIRARIGTSSTGKKVYIRKYYHDVPVGATGGDVIHPLVVPMLNALALKLIDGSIADGWEWCGPQAQDASTPFAASWPTTRTLKRRGKRPTGP